MSRLFSNNNFVVLTSSLTVKRNLFKMCVGCAHVCIASMRDDAGYVELGSTRGRGKMREPRGVRGAWDGPRSRRKEREREVRPGVSATQRARDPDSNIVLDIGWSTSLSEPTRFGAIGRTRGQSCDFLSFFCFSGGKAGSRIVFLNKKRYAIVRARVTNVATPRRRAKSDRW